MSTMTALKPVMSTHQALTSVPTEVDHIIAQEFAGKSVHGPVLLLAQHRANERLKAAGYKHRVLLEEVVDGTVYVAVHEIG